MKHEPPPHGWPPPEFWEEVRAANRSRARFGLVAHGLFGAACAILAITSRADWTSKLMFAAAAISGAGMLYQDLQLLRMFRRPKP